MTKEPKAGARQQQNPANRTQAETVSEFAGDAADGGNIAYGNVAGNAGVIIRDQDGPDGQ